LAFQQGEGAGFEIQRAPGGSPGGTSPGGDPTRHGEPEAFMSELAVRKQLGRLNGGKEMHIRTLRRAIRESGFPARPNLFGRGYIFYWSEIQAWLDGLGKHQDGRRGLAPIKRGPGRPPKRPPFVGQK
jgi:hypothetical protein